jgi:hypothetical protein
MVGVVAVLRRSGFEIGDCFTPPALALALDAFFRIFLVRSPGAGLGIAGAAEESNSISTGELVVTLPCNWSNMARGSVCACRAGDVNGLKYAPDTANCESTEK